MDELKIERDHLKERLQVVEGTLKEWQALKEPIRPAPQLVPGSRSAARHKRKEAIMLLLRREGEMATGRIIAAVSKALPSDDITRAKVQDVLQFEPEFASDRKGVWHLSEFGDAAPYGRGDESEPAQGIQEGESSYEVVDGVAEEETAMRG